MDSHKHPEFDRFERDRELVTTCRRAVRRWIDQGTTIRAADGVQWTPESARAFIEEIGRLFRQYNLVLWRTFSYCRRCQGGCCVVGASQVTVFDALALALLEEPFPELAPRAAEADCIYLGAQGCRWPQGWRPIKCWSFYCLGSGDWTLDAADERYKQITQALQGVVQRWLPGVVREAEKAGRPAHQRFLTDPIAFANALGATLFDLFVAPFSSAYGLAVEPQPGPSAGDWHLSIGASAVDAALAFVAGAVDTVYEGSQDNADNGSDDAINAFMADLEYLEWLLVTRPPRMRDELETLQRRYARNAAEEGIGSPLGNRQRKEMARVLQRLLQDAAG